MTVAGILTILLFPAGTGTGRPAAKTSPSARGAPLVGGFTPEVDGSCGGAGGSFRGVLGLSCGEGWRGVWIWRSINSGTCATATEILALLFPDVGGFRSEAAGFFGGAGAPFRGALGLA